VSGGSHRGAIGLSRWITPKTEERSGKKRTVIDQPFDVVDISDGISKTDGERLLLR